MAAVVFYAADRATWYALRVSTKPYHVRAGIRMTADSVAWSLRVLSRHAEAGGHTWTWGSAASATTTRIPCQDLPASIR
jgi:hypothetical protein